MVANRDGLATTLTAPSRGRKQVQVNATQWALVLVSVALILAVVWAVLATVRAADYRHQIDNVQQAAGHAREQNSLLRANNDLLVGLVKSLTFALEQSERLVSMTHQANRLHIEENHRLVAAQPKPRVRKAKVEPVAEPVVEPRRRGAAKKVTA